MPSTSELYKAYKEISEVWSKAGLDFGRMIQRWPYPPALSEEIRGQYEAFKKFAREEKESGSSRQEKESEEEED